MSETEAPETDTRERTVRWHDPRGTRRAVASMSGLDAMRAMIIGEIPPPPIGVLLGFELVEVDEGFARFEIDPGEHHYNPIGSVHGGVVATLLDSALGCAVHTMLPAGVGYTSLDLQVRFVRALTDKTPRLACIGRAVHVGGRTAVAEARLEDAEGRLYATASTTCMIFRP